MRLARAGSDARRTVLVRALGVLLVALVFVAPRHARADQMRQVVSANLCADQIVMALADDAQIASLGPFAHDSALSFMHERARRFPTNRGSAEEMIGLKARLVFLGTFDSRHARQVLAQRSIDFVTLAPWQSLAEGREQIRLVARHLGRADRGEALIAEIDRELAALKAMSATKARVKSALVLHRRGYVLREGIVAELLGAAGLTNAAQAFGLSQNGVVPLELIVSAPPDLLIVAQEHAEARDQGEALLLHPALTRLFPPAQRLAIPDQLSICPGPSTPALIARFARELRRHVD